MNKAFVFGKFLPFHKGHEAMIQFALTKCDFLTVLVCSSDQEKISGEKRRKWIEQSFQAEQRIEYRILDYLESELPNTSESSEDVSKIWSATFKQLLPDHTSVITSEKYGEYLADFMKIEHIPFDFSKELVPISATAIRGNLLDNWQYLPTSVKSDLALKIVILGTESSGKSTLSEHLAERYKATLVSEVGRDIIENSNSFEFEDLRNVAAVHAQKIENALTKDSPIIIIDTDIHITKSYAQFIFGKELNVPAHIYDSNKADVYLYLNNDVEHIQDGTRLTENDRNALDFSHRQTLKNHSIEFIEIKGNWQERFDQSVEQIDRLILVENQKHWT